MDEKIFSNNANLDVDFLETTYCDDLATARKVFEVYLQSLALHLNALEESFLNNDIYLFRQMMNKLKPGFGFVGLTDVSGKIQDLERKCVEGKDLVLNEIEIRELLSKIRSSRESIKVIYNRLN